MSLTLQNPLKDPSAVLDYVFDWSEEWLAAAETITDHTITADTGLTVDSSTEDAGKVTVWLSGGTAGINYKVACLVETSAGRTDERTIWIKVVER
jgi:hypothetical protein